MSKQNEKRKHIINTSQESLANIIFEKRNTKSRFKLVVKVAVYLILASIIGALISNITIKYRYGKFIRKVESIESNKDIAVLDYIKIIKEVSPSIVTISDSEEKLISDSYFEGNTTGVIIDYTGIILTNYSAIKNSPKVFVKLSSVATNPIEADILVENEEMDLAIIKIDSDVELTPIQFANDSSIREGQGIVVLGNAVGDEYIDSVIPGIITSRNEKIQIGENKKYSLLQINAPINIKNTGGAICNSEGQLVGIADLLITRERDEEGLYYGLQIEELKELINSTNNFKKMLGISEGGIIIDNARGVKGLYIQQLDKNGTAYRAGIKPTDIIVSIDECEVIDVEEIVDILHSKKKDDILNCKVLTDGKLKEIQLKIV